MAKVNLNIGAGAILLVGVVGAAFVFRDSLTKAADQAVGAVNPADDRNLINRGVSGFIEKTTDGRFLSLGDLLFNVFNPNAPGESVDFNGVPIGGKLVGRGDKFGLQGGGVE